MPFIDIEKTFQNVKVDVPGLLQEVHNHFPDLGENKPEYKSLDEICFAYKHCPKEGNNGHWCDGEPGNAKWVPEGDAIPAKHNPENNKWENILKEFDIEHVDFIEGDLDLKDISRGNVEIYEITTDRSDNFDQADMELANQKDCSPEDVARWRKENGYTWHEKADGKTMQKVPNIVHGNIPHSGGVAAAKNREREAL